MIGIFKHCFQYFEAGKYSLLLNTQVDIMYALTTVHNFINMNNPNNLDCLLEVEDEIINKENVRLTKVKSHTVIN